MANGDIQIRDPSEIERINVVGSDRDGILALPSVRTADGSLQAHRAARHASGKLDAADKITNMRRYVEHGDWVTAISLDPTGEWGLSRAGATARLFARDEERVERQLNGPPVNDARIQPQWKSCSDGLCRRYGFEHGRSASTGFTASRQPMEKWRATWT